MTWRGLDNEETRSSEFWLENSRPPRYLPDSPRKPEGQISHFQQAKTRAETVRDIEDIFNSAHFIEAFLHACAVERRLDIQAVAQMFAEVLVNRANISTVEQKIDSLQERLENQNSEIAQFLKFLKKVFIFEDAVRKGKIQTDSSQIAETQIGKVLLAKIEELNIDYAKLMSELYGLFYRNLIDTIRYEFNLTSQRFARLFANEARFGNYDDLMFKPEIRGTSDSLLEFLGRINITLADRIANTS